MKVTQPSQILDLEDEESRDQANLNMVESGTSTVEIEEGNKLQSEGSSRTFCSKKYLFDKTSGLADHSREDLKQYAEKGNIALGEIKDLFPEVETVSHHKASLFTVRDVEKNTFNIVVEEEDKVPEINIKYDNISAPNKVKFHSQTSDMLYSDYLSLNLKNSKLSSYAEKLERQLRQEKESSKAWKTQVKRLDSKCSQGVKYSLDEK
jgi:hypothetical protein